MIPDLSKDYVLDQEKIDSYRQKGHVKLDGVASQQEINFFRPVFGQIVSDLSKDFPPIQDRSLYGQAFLQLINLWTQYPMARVFTLSRRFAKIAAELMGVEGVRIYHDQALYKEAGGNITPWHQDQFYWPLDTSNTITLWMPLVDVSLEMGALSFASGSHEDGFLGHLPISEESENRFEDVVREKNYPLVAQPLSAGDATFHSGLTLHRAPGNSTDKLRAVMTIIYFADGTRILEPDNDNRRHDLKSWCPGQKPGDIAASPLNPLVYQSGR